MTGSLQSCKMNLTLDLEHCVNCKVWEIPVKKDTQEASILHTIDATFNAALTLQLQSIVHALRAK